MSSDIVPPDGELSAGQEEAASEVHRVAAKTVEALATAWDARVRADVEADVLYGPHPSGPAVQVRQRGLLLAPVGEAELPLPNVDEEARTSTGGMLAAITESLNQVNLAPRKCDSLTPYRCRSTSRANRTRRASSGRERFLPGEKQEYLERAAKLIRKARVPVAFAAFDPSRGDNVHEDREYLIVWCTHHGVHPNTGVRGSRPGSWPESQAALARYGVAWAHDTDALEQYHALRNMTNREWYARLQRALRDPGEWSFFGFKDEEDAALVGRAVSKLLDSDRSL